MISWINVPIGLVLLPASASAFVLAESRGPSRRLDIAGNVFVCLGLFGLVYSLIRGLTVGWTSVEILGSFAGGAAFLVLFVAWKARSGHPLLPLRLFRHRAFPLINLSTMLMSFGLFGSVFFLAQFLQTVQGYSPSTRASGFCRGLPCRSW